MVLLQQSAVIHLNTLSDFWGPPLPFIFEMDPEPDFVYRSAKYVEKSYIAVDETFDLHIETKMPIEQFVDSFDKLFQEKEGSQPTD